MPNIVASNSFSGTNFQLTPGVTCKGVNALPGDLILFFIAGVTVPLPDGMFATPGGFAFFTDQQLFSTNDFGFEATSFGNYCTGTLAVRDASAITGGGASGGFGNTGTTPFVTTNADNSLIIGFCSIFGSPQFVNPALTSLSLPEIINRQSGGKIALSIGQTSAPVIASYGGYNYGIANATNWIAGLMAIRPTRPPTAPTNLLPGSGIVDRSATFSWTASTDPDTPQDQLEYYGEISTTGAGGTFNFFFDWTTLTSLLIDTTNVSASANVVYRVKARDPQGNISTWATSGVFTVQHAPTIPVFTAPLVSTKWTIGVTNTIRWNPSSDPNDPTPTLVYVIGLSTNGQGGPYTTILNPSAAGATSFATNFSSFSPSSNCWLRIQGKDPSGLLSDFGYIGPFQLAADIAPLAPTNLAPNSGAQNRNAIIRLSWQFNDDGDTQKKAVIFWKKTSDASFSTLVTLNDYSNQFYDVPASTFPRADTSTGTAIQFKVVTYDQALQASPESAVAQFKATQAPANISITAPVTTIVEPRPTISWSVNAEQARFQIWVYDQFGVLMWTSDEVVGTQNSMVAGVDFPNGTTRRIDVRIKNSDGLAGNTATVTLSVVYAQPTVPTVVLTAVEPYMLLTITNPAGTPATTSNNIYRRKKGDALVNRKLIEANYPPNTPYRDYAPANAQEYIWNVEAVAANGEVTLSADYRGTLLLGWLYIYNPDDAEGTIVKLLAVLLDGNAEHDGEVLALDNRIVAEFGTVTFQSFRAGITIAPDETADLKALEALFDGKTTLYYKDADRKADYVVMMKLPYQVTVYGYDLVVEVMRVDYAI